MAGKKLTRISWNVNGLRAAMKKNFLDFLEDLDADVVALQETKLQEPQLTEEMRSIAGYESFWSCATHKKGYSGVGAYTRISPQRVNVRLDRPEFDAEGRMIEMDFGDFVFFNVYFPNGQMSAERLQFKLDFYEAFFGYTDQLKKSGPQPGHYRRLQHGPQRDRFEKSEGPTRRPRAFCASSGNRLDRSGDRGYMDTFRHLYPDTVKYSWWTYRFKAREAGHGWRIDYFFVTRDLIESGRVKEAFIDNDIYGSDHCPIGLVLEI